MWVIAPLPVKAFTFQAFQNVAKEKRDSVMRKDEEKQQQQVCLFSLWEAA